MAPVRLRQYERYCAEVSMLGDYPVRGWRFKAALAGIAALGLFGVLVMLMVSGH